MSAASVKRIERRVLRGTASSFLVTALLLAHCELARAARLFDLPWAPQTPPLPDLVVLALLMMVVQLGWATTNLLLIDRQLVSGARRVSMIATSTSFVGLIALSLLVKFFATAATQRFDTVLLAAWLSALPLAGHQVWLRLRLYRDLESHLDHERELSTRLFQQTTTDPLTGLANRLLFDDRLKRALTRASRSRKPLAVFFIDLDRMRDVNDTLGRDLGDRVLQSVAARLSEGLRGADAVCRLAGDEFLAFATDFDDPVGDVPRLADRLCNDLAQPIRLDGHDLSCTVSIGVSLFPLDGLDGAALIKHASQAMQNAKARGRNGYLLYRPEMQEHVEQRGLLEAEMRRGLSRGEFFLEYQPQVDAATGRVVGAEALVRWRHPERGALAPSQFISVAEDSLLIVALDRWVLRTACEQLGRWRRAGFRDLRLSVNLSAKNFYRDDLPEAVERALADHGIPAHFLDLEITESTLMTEAPSAVEVLKRLRAMGAGVGIDDFGTGYSSLGYLNRFPVDGLKIDRTLISDVWSSEGAAAITRAVVAIGQSLKLRVTAEGVETEDQLRFLHEHGCNLIQGFLYSRPLPPDAFEGLLRGPEFTPAAGAFALKARRTDLPS